MPLDPETECFCPRCRSGRYTPLNIDGVPVPEQLERAPWPAISRVLETYICQLCGEDEAHRDRLGMAPIPPEDWPIERGEPWLNQWKMPQ